MKIFVPYLFVVLLGFVFSTVAAQDTVRVQHMKEGKVIDFSRGYSGAVVSFTLDLSPAAEYQILWQGELIRGKNSMGKVSGTGKEVNLAGLGMSAMPGDRIIFMIKRVTFKKDGKITVVKAKPYLSSIPIF